MTTEIAEEAIETPQAIKEEDPKSEKEEIITNSVPPITSEPQKEEKSKEIEDIKQTATSTYVLPKLDLSATEDISSITSPPQSPQLPSSPSSEPTIVSSNTDSAKPATANARPKRVNKETVKLKDEKKKSKNKKEKKKESIKKGDEVIVLWDDGKRYMATIDAIIPNSPDFGGGLAYTVVFGNGDVFDVSSEQVFANDDEVRLFTKKRKQQQASEKKTEKKPDKKKEKEKPEKKKKKKKKQKRYDSDSEDTEVETETSEPEAITTKVQQQQQQQQFIMHPSIQYAQFASYSVDAKPVHIPIAIAEPVIPSANTVPVSTTTFKIIGGSSGPKILPLNYKSPLVIPANTVTQLFGNSKKAVNAIVMKQ